MLRLTSFVATASFVVLAASSQAAIIFDNPITGTNPNTANPYTTGQTVDPNITVTGIGRGAGITGTNANDRYNANSWNTTTLDPTGYFEWTLTPNGGYEIDYTDLTFVAQASGTGPTSFAFRTSADTFTGDIGTPTATGATIDLSAFQNVTTAMTFRLYGWNASGSAGTYSVNWFTFNGAVSSVIVPEPATLGAVAGLGLVALRRCRA